MTLRVIFVGNGVSEEVNLPLGVGNLWLFAEERKKFCCTATLTNQSSANMHFSNTLGWSFETMNVCRSPRVGGGGGREGFTFWPTDCHSLDFDSLFLDYLKTFQSIEKLGNDRSRVIWSASPGSPKSYLRSLSRVWCMSKSLDNMVFFSIFQYSSHLSPGES